MARRRPLPSSCSRAELRPGDVVLVKASRSGGLERVAAALLGGGRRVRQVLLAASFGLIVTLFGTPVAIRLLVRRRATAS